MAFQVPTTTASAGAPAFSFGLNTAANAGTGTAAANAKPTFSFAPPAVTAVVNPSNAGGGGADKALQPPQFGFGLSATSAVPTMIKPQGGLATDAAAATPVTSTAGATPLFGAFTAQPVGGVATTTTTTTTGTAPGSGVLNLGVTTAPKSTETVTPVAQQSTAAIMAPAATTAAPPTSGNASAFANLSTSTKTTDSSAVVSTAQLSYNQLEEHINKWTLEFEEQEKVFTEQATQINAWDKLLISNNQKILELNEAVQKVKNDQQVLDQELEFIATQHKELEESLGPLEKEFNNLSRVDVERSHTYLMVENLDTQLKQMSEDLKEVIDNLNEANKGQDNTDPIIQIGKILNAHMSSLQWIESQSANICKRLDDIGKMQETQKRDMFRTAF